MHKIRSKARHAAWTCDEGEKNFSPFSHIAHRRSNAADEESASRVATNRSENFMTSTLEERRKSHNVQDRDLPHHANTMPSSSKPAPQNGRIPEDAEEPAGENRQEVSEDSGHGTSETIVDTAGVTAEPNQPRKRRRRGLLGALTGKKEEEKPKRPPLGDKKHSSQFFKKDTQKFTVASQLRATLLNSWINVLLVFVPAGIAVHYAHLSEVAAFVVNFVAIIPLAAMLSYATEEIALRVGETLGGLLNASFGNAVELIVSILALTKNQVDIVQESLIGSILSNLLLVMGMAFFLGGIRRTRQYFNMTVAQTASSLLALAVGSLIIPAAFRSWAEGEEEDKEHKITELSRGTAILLLVVYGCYLFFQLKTHVEIYNAPSQKVKTRSQEKQERENATAGKIKEMAANVGKASALSADKGGSVALAGTGPGPVDVPPTIMDEKAAGGDDSSSSAEAAEDVEVPQLSKWVAILTLVISTALVAICAEGMVDSIDAITGPDSGVSRTFVGLILLPIVGNAAEHATAVTVAIKDKMDLSIGVAVGSSMQIALLVIPFIVVLGWILGNEEMNLAFDGFQIVVLFVSILLVNYLIQDGESHWLEGVLLCILYLIIAVAAWFYPKRELHQAASGSAKMK